MKFKPDNLSACFAHYEKHGTNKPNINETKMAVPPFGVNEQTVFKQLETLITEKQESKRAVYQSVREISQILHY